MSKLKKNGVSVLDICANTELHAEIEAERKFILKRLEKKGLTLEDINNPPKYVNPYNRDQRWNGKGRRPNWLNQLDN